MKIKVLSNINKHYINFYVTFISQTMNTVFVEAALRSINAVVIPEAPEPDLIPIFVCTVAYPS